MTPVNGDLDQMLRRAMHTEVDSIEPAEGGLERIHRRTHAPWLVRQTSLMLTECADLARLIAIRLEPRFTGVRAAIAARGGSREALVGLLSSMVSVLAGLVTPSRRRGAAHRGGLPHARARVGSNLAWLRPALAVAGAVVIVVAGVFGLAQVRDNLVLELFPSSTPAGPGASTSHQAPTLTEQSSPPVIVPPRGGTGSAKPSPKSTCSHAPSTQQVTPTPTPTASPSPTNTQTTSPSPAPTDTTNPSPSTSAATSALSVNASVGIQTTANVAPVTNCTRASPTSRASTG